MKANELMVGDMICQKFSNLVLVVSAVTPPYVQCVGEEGQFHENTIEPILLTQEILEKNGLEKDNHGRLSGEYFDEDINQDLEITVDSKTGEVWWSYNWDEYHIIRIGYVHQLQHALRLCGITREIVI